MTIKECREIAGLSVEQMAMKLGINQKEYQHYEKSPETMPIHMALLFSNIIGISYNNIFFGINSN